MIVGHFGCPLEVEKTCTWKRTFSIPFSHAFAHMQMACALKHWQGKVAPEHSEAKVP